MSENSRWFANETETTIDNDETTKLDEWDLAIMEAEQYSDTIGTRSPNYVPSQIEAQNLWTEETVRMALLKVPKKVKITSEESRLLNNYPKLIELISDLAYSVDGYPKNAVANLVNEDIDMFINQVDGEMTIEDEFALREFVLICLGMVKRPEKKNGEIEIKEVGEFSPADGIEPYLYKSPISQKVSRVLLEENQEISEPVKEVSAAKLSSRMDVTSNASAEINNIIRHLKFKLEAKDPDEYIVPIFCDEVAALASCPSNLKIIERKYKNGEITKDLLEKAVKNTITAVQKAKHKISQEELRKPSSNPLISAVVNRYISESDNELKTDQLKLLNRKVIRKIEDSNSREKLTVEMIENFVEELLLQEESEEKKSGGVLIGLNKLYAWAIKHSQNVNPVIRWSAAGLIAVLGAWILGGGNVAFKNTAPIERASILAQAPHSYLHKRDEIRSKNSKPIIVKSVPKPKVNPLSNHRDNPPTIDVMKNLKDPLLRDYIEKGILTAHSPGEGEMFLFVEMQKKITDAIQKVIQKIPKNDPRKSKLESDLQQRTLNFNKLYKRTAAGWHKLFRVEKNENGQLKVIPRYKELGTTPTKGQAEAFLKANPQIGQDEASYLLHHIHLTELQEGMDGTIPTENALDAQKVNIVDENQSFNATSNNGMAGALSSLSNLCKDATATLFATEQGNSKTKTTQTPAPVKKVNAPLPEMGAGQTFADANFTQHPKTIGELMTPMREKRINEGRRYRPDLASPRNFMQEKRDNEGRRYRQIAQETNRKIEKAFIQPNLEKINPPKSVDENVLTFCFIGELDVNAKMLKLIGDPNVLAQEYLVDQIRKSVGENKNEFTKRVTKLERLFACVGFNVVGNDGENARLQINDLEKLGEIENLVRV